MQGFVSEDGHNNMQVDSMVRPVFSCAFGQSKKMIITATTPLGHKTISSSLATHDFPTPQFFSDLNFIIVFLTRCQQTLPYHYLQSVTCQIIHYGSFPWKLIQSPNSQECPSLTTSFVFYPFVGIPLEPMCQKTHIHCPSSHSNAPLISLHSSVTKLVIGWINIDHFLSMPIRPATL